MPLEVEPKEVLTSQEPSTTKTSKNDMEFLPQDVLLERKWIMKINVGMDEIEVFGQHVRKVENIISTLAGHTLEEVEIIQSDMDGHTQMEIEMRQTVAILKCRFMEALSNINVMKAKIVVLKM